MSEQDKEGVGHIPAQIDPPILPGNAQPVKEPVPPVTESNAGNDAPVERLAGKPVDEPLSSDLLADEPAIADIDLPVQVVETVSPAVDPTPLPEKSPDDEVPPTAAAELSIWDECESFDIPEQNFRNLSPVFVHEEAPYGVDLALPPTTEGNMTRLAESKEIQTERDLLWMLNQQQASLVAPKDTVSLRRLQRPGSDWAQTVPYINPENGTKENLAFLPTALKVASGPAVRLEGSAALDVFMAGTTMGSPITVPLTNTGIWVKLSPAGASFLAELDRNLAYARMQVGLDTNGMTGSVDDLIFREIINEAALKLVTATNYPVKSSLDLRDVIDDEDHKTLSWALAKVIYPKGVMISIPCIDPVCGEVSTFRANPARMHVIDRSKLNEKQLRYLSRGISTEMSAEDIADYKSQFAKSAKYSTRLENREFIFRSPTIAQKLQIGRGWLSTVNQAVDMSMASTPDDDNKRSDVIQSITSIEQVCRWGHYVGEIRIYNDEDDINKYFTIDGEEEIRSILKSLSTAPELVDTLIAGIEEFLVDIGTTIIGYPNAPCKKCNHENVPDKMKNKLILPFDPDTGFFILAQRKISQAGGAPLTDLSTFGIENLAARAQAPGPMQYLDQETL